MTFISLWRCSNSHPRHHQHHCIKVALVFCPVNMIQHAMIQHVMIQHVMIQHAMTQHVMIQHVNMIPIVPGGERATDLPFVLSGCLFFVRLLKVWHFWSKITYFAPSNSQWAKSSDGAINFFPDLSPCEWNDRIQKSIKSSKQRLLFLHTSKDGILTQPN